MIRYAILYFVLLVVFLLLVVGPVIVAKFNVLKLSDMKIPMDLLQPTGLNNNDTQATATGRCLTPDGECPLPPGFKSAPTDGAARLARFLAY